MIYNKREVTQEQFLEMQKTMAAKAAFKVGTPVQLKGDINSPVMVVSLITVKVKSNTVNFIEELYLTYEVTWFNKSIQDFKTRYFSEECLQEPKKDK